MGFGSRFCSVALPSWLPPPDQGCAGRWTSTNSDADTAKKGTPASPATARARRVFPVPGGPSISTSQRPRSALLTPEARTPRGIFRAPVHFSASILRLKTSDNWNCSRARHAGSSRRGRRTLPGPSGTPPVRAARREQKHRCKGVLAFGVGFHFPIPLIQNPPATKE